MATHVFDVFDIVKLRVRVHSIPSPRGGLGTYCLFQIDLWDVNTIWNAQRRLSPSAPTFSRGCSHRSEQQNPWFGAEIADGRIGTERTYYSDRPPKISPYLQNTYRILKLTVIKNSRSHRFLFQNPRYIYESHVEHCVRPSVRRVRHAENRSREKNCGVGIWKIVRQRIRSFLESMASASGWRPRVAEMHEPPRTDF